MNKRVLRLFCVLVMSVAVILPVVVFAQGTSTPSIAELQQKQFGAFAGESGADFGDARPPQLIVAELIKMSLTILGTLTLVYFVYGGYLIVRSLGEEEKIEKGKKIMVNTVIGLAIIFTSYAVTDFIISRVVPLPDVSPDELPSGWTCQLLETSQTTGQDPLGDPIDVGTVEALLKKHCKF